VIDELGIRGRTVGISPVGCAVLAHNYFTFDFQEAAHGRAPAMATGIKRVRPDLMVFTYQLQGRCFSLVEVVSTYPTNWGITPLEAVNWTEEVLLPYYQLGEYKSPDT